MKRKTALLCLLALLSVPAPAAAEHAQTNLRDFRSVCINVTLELRGRKDERLREQLYNALADHLEEHRIFVASSPCQDWSSTSSRQVNLMFNFSTTTSGAAYLGTLEAWLPREGKYLEPVLWTDSIFGSLTAGSLDNVPFQIMDDLTEGFVRLWDQAH
ncbi:hypothetical protein [Deinococcus hohokamensis]|uniref:Uncharacterized protein n=1 Tax=Deinococcus hohokamensis TaxID=309883 RepID=A0ABV9I831_9DEIO